MAVRRFETNPRKSPLQRRSRATVEAVINATSQVLVKSGYEGTTTARVAERAGVSIGSLYQYFPNKEALVAALIERHGNDMVAVFHSVLERPRSLTLAEGLRAVIDASVQAHRVSPRLHKVLHEQIPRIGGLAKALDVHREITATVEQFLRAHRAEIAVQCEPGVLAVVVETTLEALIHKAVIDRDELLEDGVLEREAFRLLISYLEAPRPARRSA